MFGYTSTISCPSLSSGTGETAVGLRTTNLIAQLPRRFPTCFSFVGESPQNVGVSDECLWDSSLGVSTRARRRTALAVSQILVAHTILKFNSGVHAVMMHQMMNIVTATKKAPTRERVATLEYMKQANMNAKRKERVLLQRM